MPDTKLRFSMNSDLPVVIPLVVVIGGAMLWILPNTTYLSAAIMAALALFSLTIHRSLSVRRRLGYSPLTAMVDRRYAEDAPDSKPMIERMGPKSDRPAAR